MGLGVPPRADDQFSRLESDLQGRIVSKLDELVSSEWRGPGDFLEPLTGSPLQKLGGDFRLGCRLMRDDRVLRVESIRKRGGAYTADD